MRPHRAGVADRRLCRPKPGWLQACRDRNSGASTSRASGPCGALVGAGSSPSPKTCVRHWWRLPDTPARRTTAEILRPRRAGYCESPKAPTKQAALFPTRPPAGYNPRRTTLGIRYSPSGDRRCPPTPRSLGTVPQVVSSHGSGRRHRGCSGCRHLPGQVENPARLADSRPICEQPQGRGRMQVRRQQPEE